MTIMLSRFHLIPERNGRMDRQTDGQICYINIARQYNKNRPILMKFQISYTTADVKPDDSHVTKN